MQHRLLIWLVLLSAVLYPAAATAAQGDCAGAPATRLRPGMIAYEVSEQIPTYYGHPLVPGALFAPSEENYDDFYQDFLFIHSGPVCLEGRTV